MRTARRPCRPAPTCPSPAPRAAGRGRSGGRKSADVLPLDVDTPRQRRFTRCPRAAATHTRVREGEPKVPVGEPRLALELDGRGRPAALDQEIEVAENVRRLAAARIGALV